MTAENEKKKGLLAILRESLAKTGGCCGPGETCGSPAKAAREAVTGEAAAPEEQQREQADQK